MAEPPTLSDLIRAGGLQTPQEADELLWPAVAKALDEAMRASRRRGAGGKRLEAEIRRLLDGVEEKAARRRHGCPRFRKSCATKLRARVDELGCASSRSAWRPRSSYASIGSTCRRSLFACAATSGGRATSCAVAAGWQGARLPESGTPARGEHAWLEGARWRRHRVTVDMKVAIEQLQEQVQNVE